MPDVFIMIDRLEKLRKSSKISRAQKEFIATVLDGKSDQWRPLSNISQTSLRDGEIDIITMTLKSEIGKTAYFDFTNGINITYKKTLNKLLKCLIRVKLYLIYLSCISDGHFQSMMTNYETLYHKTINEYHGSILFSVIQNFDVRLGSSGGDCRGYFHKWMLALFDNNNPFGFKLDNAPLFKHIKFDSPLGIKFPTLNHLAPLNPDISRLQKKYFPDNILPIPKTILRFFKNTSLSAKQLIQFSDADPDKIYALCIYGGNIGFSGHILGFCKRNNEYHFFDANRMSVSFKSAEHFQNWLHFYFTAMGYYNTYREYFIVSYQPISKMSALKKFSMAVLSPIFLTFAIPIGSLYSLYWLIVRPIRHKIHPTNQIPPIENIVTNEILPRHRFTDDMEFIFKPARKTKFLNSTGSIAITLDIDLKNIKYAKKQLKTNQNKVLPIDNKSDLPVHSSRLQVKHFTL